MVREIEIPVRLRVNCAIQLTTRGDEDVVVNSATIIGLRRENGSYVEKMEPLTDAQMDALRDEIADVI